MPSYLQNRPVLWPFCWCSVEWAVCFSLRSSTLFFCRASARGLRSKHVYLSSTGMVTPKWAEEGEAGRNKVDPASTRRESGHWHFCPSPHTGLSRGHHRPGPQFPPFVMVMEISPILQVVGSIMGMVTELCKGPSHLQTPHNGGDGLGQWVRTEEAESEIRDPDSSPSCR